MPPLVPRRAGWALIDKTGPTIDFGDEPAFLVDNGIKYGRSGGMVEVRAKPLEPNEIEFMVCDDGPGISAEALDRIFERFYREDKARSREQGGTGLGLAIVKHIVQSHRGKVWAESSPGHGTSFHFTLPRTATS